MLARLHSHAQAKPFVLLKKPQVVHDGIQMSCNDVVEICVGASVHDEFRRQLEAVAMRLDAILTSLNDVKSAVAEFRVHLIFRCVANLEHGDEAIKPLGGSEDCSAKRHSHDDPKHFVMWLAVVVGMPDVSRSVYPLLEPLSFLFLVFFTNTSQFNLCPIFTSIRHEECLILVFDGEVFFPQLCIFVHREVYYRSPTLLRLDENNTAFDGLPHIKLNVAAFDEPRPPVRLCIVGFSERAPDVVRHHLHAHFFFVRKLVCTILIQCVLFVFCHRCTHKRAVSQLLLSFANHQVKKRNRVKLCKFLPLVLEGSQDLRDEQLTQFEHVSLRRLWERVVDQKLQFIIWEALVQGGEKCLAVVGLLCQSGSVHGPEDPIFLHLFLLGRNRF
mmetsp:Transcript_5573/g.9251  ORF Transcript_5573/g.9251 Transcript_5573/m.9251 type:complete len:386 (-) Transcript_5573:3250-4407(-)